LNKKHVLGRIRGFLPHIGILTIILNDYPWLKWSVLAIMAIMVLTSNDPNEN
jgi:signal peptidase